MEENQVLHKRRERYKGKYPKNYKEKYKELNPEKYADVIEKVKNKGNTPAGMHISICVKEILDFLDIKPGQQGIDATLGYGGHSGEMLKCLNGSGHLYALDVDPIESVKTEKRLREKGFDESVLTIKHINFKDIDQVVKEHGKMDFLLADLGVSSMQIDNPDRGFSFKQEGPLDLRLNPRKGVPAWERLLDMTEEEIAGMLIENADEPYAQVIAHDLYYGLKKGLEIKTTTQLKNLIEAVVLKNDKKATKEDIKKTCQRTFQAIRIDVNSEFEVLQELLDKLPLCMKDGGKVAILTFHSGEDRLVKKSFQQFYRDGLYQDYSKEVIRPSAEECVRNSRAKSAKLRWAVK